MAMSLYVRRLRAAMGQELLVLPSVTGIIYDERDRILLVRQSEGGIWSAPGGSVDADETPADAVVREVWEETGLDATPVRLLGVYGGPSCVVTYPNGDRTAYAMAVFECEVRGGALRQTSDETTAAEFVALPSYPGTAFHRGCSTYCRDSTIGHGVSTSNRRRGGRRRCELAPSNNRLNAAARAEKLNRVAVSIWRRPRVDRRVSLPAGNSGLTCGRLSSAVDLSIPFPSGQEVV